MCNRNKQHKLKRMVPQTCKENYKQKPYYKSKYVESGSDGIMYDV